MAVLYNDRQKERVEDYDMDNYGDIIIYKTEDSTTKIDVNVLI